MVLGYFLNGSSLERQKYDRGTAQNEMQSCLHYYIQT